MGLFSGAKAQMDAQKAYRTHISANRFYNDGKLEQAKAKYDQALELYARAYAEGIEKPAIRLGYAILLMRLGEFDKAGEVMQGMRLMKNMTDSDWFDLRMNYSIYLWKTGRLDDAIATIDRAAKIKMNAGVYTTKGMFLVDQARETGDFSAVQAFNEEAMGYDDEDGGVLDNVGAMYEAMMDKAIAEGDAARAAEYRKLAKENYAKAHEAKPRQITTIYALAKLCHEDGEDARAREVMEDTDSLLFSAVCPVSQEMMETLKAQVG